MDFYDYKSHVLYRVLSFFMKPIMRFVCMYEYCFYSLIPFTSIDLDLLLTVF